MALAHCALSSTISPPPSSSSSHNSTTIRKPQSSLTSLPNPPRRKNHLRLKLLKTLTKPHPTPPLPPHPPPEYPQETQELLPVSTETLNEEEKELTLQNIQETQVGVPEAENLITTRSVIELVLYIVGFLIVQTAITVYIMGFGDAKKKTKNDENLELNEKKNIIQDSNANLGNVDEAQYIGKIAEIRAMAREVRERERKNSSGVIEYEEDVSVPKQEVGKVKGNIEKEVDVKLSKLERKFGSLKEKPFMLKVSNLNNPDAINGKKNVGSLNGKVKNENLVFKKKLKNKTAPFNFTSEPKGFGSGNRGNVINGSSVSQNADDTSEADGDDVLNDGSLGITPDKEEKVHVPGRNSLQDILIELDSGKGDNGLLSKKMGSADEVVKKTEKEMKSSNVGETLPIDNSKLKSGMVRESSSKQVESKNANELKTNTSPAPTRHIEHKQVVNNSGFKQASTENDMWWLNLRYVLAILLRRSSESDGPGGLYSLKMEDGSPSYLVAFEDQVDASNFCCILDAFFAELGDLIADVVPLSKQELTVELEENNLKIIVLRKGQLQLYAGQPLADVEMTLRSLVRN